MDNSNLEGERLEALDRASVLRVDWAVMDTKGASSSDMEIPLYLWREMLKLEGQLYKCHSEGG